MLSGLLEVLQLGTRTIYVNGVEAIIHEARSGKTTTVHDLRRFLKRFCLDEALLLISALSGDLSLKQDSGVVPINGVPVCNAILAYLAAHLIDVANDYRSNEMQLSDIATATEMYLSMNDPVQTDPDPRAMFVRAGQSFFDYCCDFQYLCGETLWIYRDLWYRVPSSSAIDIGQAIREHVGLDLEEILVLSTVVVGRATNRGLFTVTPYQQSHNSIPLLASTLCSEKQERFLEWTSNDYCRFRDAMASTQVRDGAYSKSSLNPLRLTPIIQTHRHSSKRKRPVYVAPVPLLILDRVTRGLYHELSEFYGGDGKRNKFRTAFGLVFQEYVGYMIRESAQTGVLHAEITYSKGQRRSVDWILRTGSKAVLIEVKQSSLYLSARTSGDFEMIRRDLSRTLAKAVEQMVRFEADLSSGEHPELRQLRGVVEIERLIVTYDRPYSANWMLRKEIVSVLRETSVTMPVDFSWQAASAEELSLALLVSRGDLWQFLRTKRSNDEWDTMDFRDYVSCSYSTQMADTLDFVKRPQEELFERFGLGTGDG